MPAILTFLANIWTPIGQALGLVKQRDAELNTPKMEQNLEAKRRQEQIDSGRQAIDRAAESGKPEDLDEIRKRDS